MAKRERKGGGRQNLPSHVEAAVTQVSTPEQAHETRDDKLQALGAKPKEHPRAELPVIEGRRIKCPRAGCGSIHSQVIATSVYDALTKARMVRRRCRSCRQDFLVHET